MAGCPFLSSQTAVMDQFSAIREQYPVLSSTGCTKNFCQSGRMIHTDEERVGRNRPYSQVREEAIDFLQQMYREGMFSSAEAFHERVQEVLDEIQRNSKEGSYQTAGAEGPEVEPRIEQGLVGGHWTQTYEELEFGIRTAWKHSRKCIMRSEYKELRLCDLRHIKTSKKMAQALIQNLKIAYNNGEINPTVFMFPPRTIDKRGPMVWNHQLLAFAGYRDPESGAVLGDPANADLTEAIIELGWTPPAPSARTQWDLLPIVTMAEGEEPVITELPRKAFPLVHIRHPGFPDMEKLGLRWVPAPALSRLGFTIGGVQYTASPFIGWFMDAEIGVRNLADSFRYNMLPAIAKAIGLTDKNVEDLRDYERLAVLSRAQLELNYAVYWSFAQANVRMSDSLGAAEQFSQFDDEHLAQHGFRLPSDPYWLAPPQGSIIPLWHSGGSPNYQPKPMICRHVQDPIRAWRREREQRQMRIPVISGAMLDDDDELGVPSPFLRSRPATPSGSRSVSPAPEARSRRSYSPAPSAGRAVSLATRYGRGTSPAPSTGRVASPATSGRAISPAAASRSGISPVRTRRGVSPTPSRRGVSPSPSVERGMSPRPSRSGTPALLPPDESGDDSDDDERRIFVAFCSSGNVAIKLCKRLHSQLQLAAREDARLGRIMPVSTLDALPPPVELAVGDVIVVVASTTGQGEIPQNGRVFAEGLADDNRAGRSTLAGRRYAVFANGSTEYADTYNQAALDIADLLAAAQAMPLFLDGAVVEADTAAENPPWTAFDAFYARLVERLVQTAAEDAAVRGGDTAVAPLPPTPQFTPLLAPSKTPTAQFLSPVPAKQPSPTAATTTAMAAPAPTTRPRVPAKPFDTRPWITARVVRELVVPPLDDTTAEQPNMRRVTLDLGASKEYQPMGTVWLLPPNQSAAVAGALAALGVGPSEKVAVPGEPTVEQWLRLFANLDRPFKNLEWTNRFPSSSSLPGGGTLKEQMEKLDVSTALRHLPANWAATVSLTDICKAMYTIAPREYSIASAPSYGGDGGKGCTTTIDLLVQRHCNGKFSNDFLGSLMATAASGGAVSDTTMTEIACRLRSTSSQLLPFVTGTSPSPSSPDEQQQQQKSASLAPLILLTTGSGMAPVRSLLQHRLSQLATAANDDDGKISLFANFRPGDAALIEESVTDGRTAGLFDVLEMVASNPQKRRAQDAMLAPPAPASASGTGSGYEGDVAALIKHKIEHRNALVFACARPQAVEAFLDTLGRVLSLGEGKAEEVREKLGNRLAVEGYVPAV